MALSYAEGIALLARGRKGRKKLDNNTYLHRVDEVTLAVQLDETDVVLIHADGGYTLNSGGSQAVTTKGRINDYAPVRLYADKWLWYLCGRGEDGRWDRSTRALFFDGIKVDGRGHVLGAATDPAPAQADEKELRRLVRRYIKGFAAHAVADGGLTVPSNGDCMGCHFRAATALDGMAAPAPSPFGMGHFFSHFEEEYFVPSLLWNAISERGQGLNWTSTHWHILDLEARRGQTGLLERDLARYFRRLQPALLEALGHRRHDPKPEAN
jgi:hypothetical protein